MMWKRAGAPILTNTTLRSSPNEVKYCSGLVSTTMIRIKRMDERRIKPCQLTRASNMAPMLGFIYVITRQPIRTCVCR